jgi:hypothetical protein
MNVVLLNLTFPNFLMCDLHSLPFQSHISWQFAISYDLYLSLRNEANNLTQKALGRDSEDWRLHHVCPPCTYVLEYEEKLKFSMLYTMDGNDSLKRIQRREAIPISTDNNSSNVPVLGKSNDQQTPILLARGFTSQMSR